MNQDIISTYMSVDNLLYNLIDYQHGTSKAEAIGNQCM